MGFHCGNTPSCCLCQGCSMKHQLIMHRLMEPGKAPDITCGTLEGTLRAGPVTMYRLQPQPYGGGVHCYLAEGHSLDADPSTFGSVGILAIPGFARFYRYIMLGKEFPHHTALAFAHSGQVLFDASMLLGADVVWTPKPDQIPYDDENPFSR